MKTAEGVTSTLTSDGTTITLFTEGDKTYKELPAPKTFEEFAELPGLDEANLSEFASILPFLSADLSKTEGEEAPKGTRLLEAADLEGKRHDRVQASFDGNQAVLWLDKQAGFPLVKIDIDAAKMLDDQLADLGEQAAALKSAIKIEAAMKFTNSKLNESFPEDAFRFVPAKDTTKE